MWCLTPCMQATSSDKWGASATSSSSSSSSLSWSWQGWTNQVQGLYSFLSWQSIKFKQQVQRSFWFPVFFAHVRYARSVLAGFAFREWINQRLAGTEFHGNLNSSEAIAEQTEARSFRCCKSFWDHCIPGLWGWPVVSPQDETPGRAPLAWPSPNAETPPAAMLFPHWCTWFAEGKGKSAWLAWMKYEGF